MVEHVYYDYDKKIECKELIEFSPSKDMNAKKIIDRFVCDWQDGNLYRGISNRANLYSKLLANSENFNDRKTTLYHTLGRFMKYINAFATTVSEVDLLIKFHHYGGETNLIDFTYNPLVALFFCLARKKNKSDMYEVISFSKGDYCVAQETIKEEQMQEEKSNLCNDLDKSASKQSAFANRIIFGTCTLSLESKVGNEESSSDAKIIPIDLDDIIKYKPKDKDAITILEPFTYTNQRIINQQGVLCLTSLDFDKDATLKFVLKNARVYRINEAFRDEILRVLEALGFDEIHLFPDLHGLVQHAIKK